MFFLLQKFDFLIYSVGYGCIHGVITLLDVGVNGDFNVAVCQIV